MKNQKYNLSLVSQFRSLNLKFYDEQLLTLKERSLPQDSVVDLIEERRGKFFNAVKNWDSDDCEIYVIYHNKDVSNKTADILKNDYKLKPHYHLAVSVVAKKGKKRVKSVNFLLKKMGITFTDDDVNLLDNGGLTTLTNKYNFLFYLTHQDNKSVQAGKTPYDLTDVVSNLSLETLKEWINLSDLYKSDDGSLSEKLTELKREFYNCGLNYDYEKFNFLTGNLPAPLLSSYNILEREFNKGSRVFLSSFPIDDYVHQLFSWRAFYDVLPENIEFCKSFSSFKNKYLAKYSSYCQKVTSELKLLKLNMYIYGGSGIGKTSSIQLACQRLNLTYGTITGTLDKYSPFDNFNSANDVMYIDDPQSSKPFTQFMDYSSEANVEVKGRYSNSIFAGDYFIVSANLEPDEFYSKFTDTSVNCSLLCDRFVEIHASKDIYGCTSFKIVKTAVNRNYKPETQERYNKMLNDFVTALNDVSREYYEEITVPADNKNLSSCEQLILDTFGATEVAEKV